MSATTTAMRQGQRRYQRDQRRQAIARVRAFRRWQQHGYDTAHLPSELPTDHDFRLAREAGR